MTFIELFEAIKKENEKDGSETWHNSNEKTITFMKNDKDKKVKVIIKHLANEEVVISFHGTITEAAEIFANIESDSH